MFNDILVLVNDYTLSEINRPTIVDISERISYYEGIVEEYYYILNTLIELQNNLSEDDQIDISHAILELNNTFDKYKEDLIVANIVDTIESNTQRVSFFDKITKFEKSLVALPLIKIDESSIQSVLTVAKIFAEVSPNLYYFETNPYMVDETYNVVIPVKRDYEAVDVFLNGLYNYLFGIFNTYKYKNSAEIETMEANESLLEGRLNEYQNYILSISSSKIDTTYINTPTDYYSRVNEIMDSVDLYKEQLISMFIYRYYELNERFREILIQIDTLKNYYFSNTLYVEALEKIDFQNKLVELQDNIILIEKGIVIVDKDYVVSEGISFKELVEIIITMSQKLKTNIYYTQQFNVSGQPVVCEFTFYQTSDFLNSVKSYYYQLMTTDGFDFNTILLEDFGDTTTVELRNIYTTGLAKYNDYLAQPIDYMVDFELTEFISSIEVLQSQLKREAATFFNNAFETSPLTFAPTIEKYYKQLLDKLALDIVELKEVHNQADFSDEIRDKALVILNKSVKYSNDLEVLLVQDKNYSMLGMSIFINEYLVLFFKEYETYIKDGFNQEDYARVIAMEVEFYKTSAINHNMFVALSDLSNNVEMIFDHFNLAQTIFVNEQISKSPVERTDSTIGYINYLFDDNMFEAIRQQVSSELDNFYTYVIDKRPNEKPFLINEKNLKLSYFDNSYIKINYIRLYDKLVVINEEYNTELGLIHSENTDDAEYISSFDYVGQLETLISYQNTILANLTRTLVEQDIDVNYTLDTVLESAIGSIHEFNEIIIPSIEKYTAILVKYREINKYKETVLKHNEIKALHSDSWITILNKNIIDPIKPISYNDLDVITGTLPFAIEMSADFDLLVDDMEAPEFKWDIDGVILTGKEVSYTIYKEGITKVICSRVYPSGETTVRYVEFDISGPTNSQVVKSNFVNYAPITEYINQPKITYWDAETETQVTVVINVSGNVADMIGEGSITVAEGDGDLLLEKAGFVILGFEGVEIAGKPFDYTSVFAEEFEMPEEADFLFDFQVSDPIANKSVIDISNSVFIDYMAKVPSTAVQSVYDISDASEFQRHADNTLPVIVGDIIVMRNKVGRYAVIEIKNISSLTDVEEGKYNFEIGFDIHVNISLNIYEQNQFKPLTTNYVVPTLVFETNSKELFSGLIERIELINTLTIEMDETIDNERKIILTEEIKLIKVENEKFYLFSEYNRLKAKTMIVEEKLSNIKPTTDYEDLSSTELQLLNIDYVTNLEASRTFTEYMDETTLYDFRNNIIDLDILNEMYVEEQLMMKIILDTFDYTSYDLDYFISKFNSCKYIDNALLSVSQYDNLSYIKQLPLVVANARTHLFRLKLLINLPILVAGKYIIPSTSFDRLSFDINGDQVTINDMDLYLLNKKIELNYGYEIPKEVISDDNIISIITEIVKDTQGIGLSETDRTTLGKYIDEVERKCVIEYDDFFMLPFWMDYLTKLL